ncbi:MAG: T9SS type A sorting domain-containing protein [Candidatus Latescibacteria bacterium]|nr:T9SS type A sorting domain-containing protein [Candidatus Latescibacterota bacterium]
MKIRYWIFILLIFLNFLWAQNPLKIYCIDVNQGSSTLIVSPTNKYVLIDAGDSQGNYGDSVFRFIRNLGITHLDHTIATHYHSDHIGGFRVVICSLSGGAGRNDSILGFCYDRGDTYTTATYLNYKSIVDLKRKTIELGETLDLGGGAFMICIVSNGKVMNGDSVLPNSGENYRSIGLLLKYGFFECWVGGDLTGSSANNERDVETIVARVVGDIDLYIANHHGSKHSSNSTFLDSLRPEVTIFSQGIHPFNYGHPHQDVINRLIARNSYLYQLNANLDSSGIFQIPDSGKILNTSAVITVDNFEYIVNGDTYPIDDVRRDGTVVEIVSPKDTISEGTVITPRAKIKNLGNVTETFSIRFKIGSIYNQTKTISGLAPNDTITISFDTTWTAIIGNYQITCSTQTPRDINSANDKKSANLTVIPITFGWQKKKDIEKSVKDGGALVTAQGKIYAFPGNKTLDFYCYDPSIDIWQKKESIPFWYKSGKPIKKSVKKGGALTFGQDNLGRSVIFAIKGNNTKEFWKYLIAQDSWIFECELTIAFKGGSALAYVSRAQNDKSVYVLWGNNKEYKFRAYNAIAGTWIDKDSSPKGKDNKKFRDGSCMVALRDSIFVLKGGAKYNEFYCYDIVRDTWVELEPLPQNHPDINRKKKVKAGGAITYDAHTNKIYAFKGGGTQEFWSYDIAQNSWTPKETIPKDTSDSKKSIVKAGGSLTALSGIIYAFKGNNRTEFWQYRPMQTEKTDIVNRLHSRSDQASYVDHAQPTPQSEINNNNIQLRNLKITIFNIAGQVLKTEKIPDLQSINQVKQNLTPGVYFISITPQDQNSIKFSKKIVIPH